jgi:hypothetical protein
MVSQIAMVISIASEYITPCEPVVLCKSCDVFVGCRGAERDGKTLTEPDPSGTVD